MANNPNAAANLIPNKPGERRGGRKKGTPDKLTKERVEKELRFLAFSDPKALFTAAYGGRKSFTLREINDMAPEIRRCIASVKVRRENLGSNDNEQDLTVEVKLWDKVKALELCGRALGLFKDKVEVSASGELAAVLAEGRQRAAERNKKRDE